MIPRGNQIVEDFHRLYFNDVFDKQLRVNWLGVEVLKCPTDLLVYQEIIHEIRPDLIVEIPVTRNSTLPAGSTFIAVS